MATAPVPTNISFPNEALKSLETIAKTLNGISTDVSASLGNIAEQLDKIQKQAGKFKQAIPTSTEINKTTESLRGFKGQIQQFNQTLAKVPKIKFAGDNAKNVSNSIAKGIAYPVTVGARHQQLMSELEATFLANLPQGISAELYLANLPQLSEEIKDVASRKGWDPSELVEGANVLIKSQYSPLEIKAILETLIDSATSMKVGLKQAATDFAQINNYAFAENSPDKFKETANVMTYTNLTSPANFDIFTEMLKGTAPIARDKMEFKELAGLSMKYTESGVNIEKGTVVLRNALSKLFQPDSQRFLQPLGISRLNHDGSAKSFIAILEDIYKTLNNQEFSTDEQFNIFKNIVGERNVPEFMTLIDTVGQGVALNGDSSQKSDLRQYIESMSDNNPAFNNIANRTSNKVTDNVSGNTDVMGATIKKVFSNIFDSVEPEISKSIKYIQTHLNSLYAFMKENPAFVETVFYFAVGVGAAAAAIASFLVLTASFVTTVALISLILGGLASLALPLAALGVAAISIYHHWDRLKTFFQGFTDGFKSVFSSLSDAISPIKEALKPVDDFFTTMQYSIAETSKASHVMGQSVDSAFSGMTGRFSEFDARIESMQQSFIGKNIGQSIAEAFKIGIEYIAKFVKVLVQIGQYIYENFSVKNIKVFFASFQQVLIDTFGSFKQAFKPLTDILKPVFNDLTNFGNSLQKSVIGAETFAAAGKKAGEVFSYVFKSIIWMASQVTEAIVIVGRYLYNSFSFERIGAFFTSFADGFKSIFKSAKEAFKPITEAFKPLSTSLQTSSLELKDFSNTGSVLGKAVASAINKVIWAFGRLIKMLDTVRQYLAQTFSVEKIWGFFEGLSNGFIRAFGSFNKAIEPIKQALRPISDYLQGSSASVKDFTKFGEKAGEIIGKALTHIIWLASKLIKVIVSVGKFFSNIPTEHLINLAVLVGAFFVAVKIGMMSLPMVLFITSFFPVLFLIAAVAFALYKFKDEVIALGQAVYDYWSELPNWSKIAIGVVFGIFAVVALVATKLVSIPALVVTAIGAGIIALAAFWEKMPVWAQAGITAFLSILPALLIFFGVIVTGVGLPIAALALFAFAIFVFRDKVARVFESIANIWHGSFWGKLGLVLIVSGGLGAVLFAIYKFGGKLGASFVGILSTAKSFATKFIGLLSNLVKTAVTMLGKMFGMLNQPVGQLLKTPLGRLGLAGGAGVAGGIGWVIGSNLYENNREAFQDTIEEYVGFGFGQWALETGESITDTGKWLWDGAASVFSSEENNAVSTTEAVNNIAAPTKVVHESTQVSNKAQESIASVFSSEENNVVSTTEAVNNIAAPTKVVHESTQVSNKTQESIASVFSSEENNAISTTEAVNNIAAPTKVVHESTQVSNKTQTDINQSLEQPVIIELMGNDPKSLITSDFYTEAGVSLPNTSIYDLGTMQLLEVPTIDPQTVTGLSKNILETPVVHQTAIESTPSSPTTNFQEVFQSFNPDKELTSLLTQNTALSDLQKQAEELSSTVLKQDTGTSELQKQMDEARANLSAASTPLKQDVGVAELQKQMDDMKAKLSTASTPLKQDAGVAELQKQMDDMKARLSTASTPLKQDTGTSELQKQMDDMKARLSTAPTPLKQDAGVAELQKQMDEIKTQSYSPILNEVKTYLPEELSDISNIIESDLIPESHTQAPRSIGEKASSALHKVVQAPGNLIDGVLDGAFNLFLGGEPDTRIPKNISAIKQPSFEEMLEDKAPVLPHSPAEIETPSVFNFSEPSLPHSDLISELDTPTTQTLPTVEPSTTKTAAPTQVQTTVEAPALSQGKQVTFGDIHINIETAASVEDAKEIANIVLEKLKMEVNDGLCDALYDI